MIRRSRLSAPRIGLILGLLGSFFLSSCVTGRIEIREFSPTGESVSPAIVTVAHISDLHIGSDIWPIHREAARMLMEINPDILLLTGDAVDMGDAWENLGTWLRSLDIPSAHKFAVLGNWEYSVGFDPEELRRLYAAHGFTLLINESRDLFFSGGTIRITGLDDGRYGEPDFRVINPNLGYPEIVMIHEPLLADEIAEEGVSGKILISGHTHGGQMAFGGRPIYFPPSWGNYIAGDFHVAGNHLYVSKGIGMSTLNIRFGARPDIIVLHIDPVIVSPNE